MELKNRITSSMVVLVTLSLLFTTYTNAQPSSRGGRGGSGMSGGMRGSGPGDPGQRGDWDMPGGGGMTGGMRGGGPGDWDNMPGGGRSGRGGSEELTEGQLDRVLELFSTRNPSKAKELEELRKTDKEKFVEELTKVAFFDMLNISSRDREYKTILVWCEKFVADEAAGIRVLQDENYDLYKKRLDSLRDKYGSLIYTRGVSDELMHIMVRDLQLRNKLSDLSQQYRNPRTSDDKKEALLVEIREAHSEQYDQDIKRTKVALQEIKDEIDRLNARYEGVMNQITQAEDPVVKKRDIDELMKLYTEPFSPYFRRGGFGGRRSMPSSYYQIQEPNLNPAQ